MTRGERVIAFIEFYCRVPEGKHIGKPLVLDDFQKKFILEVYDNPYKTRKAILSLARKNGKTALIAALVLCHVVGTEAVQNSQIISGAMSREQAAIVFNLAVKMINLNPELQELIHIIPSKKTLIGMVMNVEYRAISAEGKTAHGLSPVLAILDETGQVAGQHSDFVDAITTSQGAHDESLLIVISTQAANDTDLLSVWIDDALTGADKSIICHLYTADIEADILNIDTWRQANPALGSFRSLVDMESLANSASRMPSSESSFRNLNLNQRVSAVSPFVSKSVWEACGGEPDSLEGLDVYGGLDLSARTDLTAFVLRARDANNVVHVKPYFWTPEKNVLERAKRDGAPYDLWIKQGYLRTTPGYSVDYDFVVNDIAEIICDLNVVSIAFDRWRIDLFKKECERNGYEFPLVEHGQGFKDMAPSLDSLEVDLLNSRLRHGMHPVLTMCAANAVVTKNPAGDRKLDKSKASGRIDGMVALAMSLGSSDDAIYDDADDFSQYINKPLGV